MPDKDTQFYVEKVYGYAELIPTARVQGPDIVLGGIYREYDGAGNLIEEKTEDTIIVKHAADLINEVDLAR